MSTDPWLATVVAEAASEGAESPDETIAPRRPRATDATALLDEHTARGGQPLVLLDTLAIGGMGVIKLARQTSLGREVAIKSLRGEAREPECAAELLREAWVTGALEHPNVVPVHDIATDEDGLPQVVMKRIAGRSWSEILEDPDRRPRGDLGQLRGDLEILCQVINAVRFAHDRSILHRDLKPANVMIGEFGEVYVVDWGLAVSVDEEAGDGRITRASEAAGKLAGTPAYMAPEMLGGDGAVLDERTDVYLLGAILYELMTGQVPHRGRTLVEALEHVRDGDPPFPADLPAELLRICRRALARDPADRHPSAGALLADVRGFLDHLSSSTLAAEAERPLGELLALLDTGEPDRGRAYNLFGECRFGFRAALATWPENPVAIDGLGRAVSRMVEHELERGDGDTALALLAEHPEPPEALERRAAASAEARRERDERLARLERDNNPNIARAPRIIAAIAMSAAWVLLPLVLGWLDFESRVSRATFHDGAVIVLIAWCVLLGGFGVAFRDALGGTRINRVLFWGVYAGGPATAMLMFGIRQLDLPIVTPPILSLVVWTTVAAVLTIAVDWRLFPGAVIYGVAFVVAAVVPGLRYTTTAIANLLVGAAAVWLWTRAGSSAPSARPGRPARAPARSRAPSSPPAR